MRRLSDRYAELMQDEATALAPPAQPTAVHVQFVNVVNNMLAWCTSSVSSETPAIVRTGLKVVHRMQEQLAGQLATVDPEVIRSIAREMRDQLDSIVIAGLPLVETKPAQIEEAHDDDTSDFAGADQSAQG